MPLILDIRVMEAFEIAATLDAHLAFPQAREKTLQRKIRMFCADQISATIDTQPWRKTELIGRYPTYNPALFRDRPKNIQNRRDNALKFGKIVLTLLCEEATGRPSRLPQSCPRSSFDQIVRFLYPGEHPTQLHDIEKREIRSRFPVAHLCAGLQWLAHERAAASGYGAYEYQDIDFLRRWVAKASEIAELIRETSELTNIANALIDIQWIEPVQVFAPGNRR